jgi:glycosyltransferase involved in cell wall biosynthesis
VKILYVVNNAAFFCSHRLPLALAARAAGHEVALATGAAGSATMEADAVRQLRGLGIVHHVTAFTSSGTNPVKEGAAILLLALLMRRWRPDVVHCASPKGVLYGGLAARLAGVPGLVLAVTGMGTLFTGAGGLGRRWLRRLYGAAVRLAYGHPRLRVIVQNEDDRAAVVSAGLARPDELTLIPGSGVVLDRYVQLPIEPREALVVLPARMLGDKGVHEFVAAARSLRAEGWSWRFALVGTADYANPTSVPEARLREWENAGLVEWWGHRADMPAVFAQARIVCLPSYREGMPKALLEAAAAGCAVITTDTVGCREAVLPGVTGELVPVADAPALARALRRLMGDAALCRNYGKAGRQWARERFDIESVIRKTLALYHELAN